mmetsp:Transcript_70625/g.188274  ORF Transcript_70625/g.188274 Transcript_70625/m.188274 type:complete len:357 (+) Transcript_70625:1661-2731(+)
MILKWGQRPFLQEVLHNSLRPHTDFADPGDTHRVRPPAGLVPAHSAYSWDPGCDGVLPPPLHRAVPGPVDPPVRQDGVPERRVTIRRAPDGVVAPTPTAVGAQLHQQALDPRARGDRVVPGLPPHGVCPGQVLLRLPVGVCGQCGDKVASVLHALWHAHVVLADDGDHADVAQRCYGHFLVPDLGQGLVHIRHHRQHRRHAGCHGRHIPAPQTTKRQPCHHHSGPVPDHPLCGQFLQHLKHVPPHDHGLVIHCAATLVGEHELRLLLAEVTVRSDYNAGLPDLLAAQRALSVQKLCEPLFSPGTFPDPVEEHYHRNRNRSLRRYVHEPLQHIVRVCTALVFRHTPHDFLPQQRVVC